MKEFTMQNDCTITETEKETLLHNISKLLDEYDYSYSRCALEDIIDEWASQKRELITAFKTHPNYVEGKFMIAFNYDYERAFDATAIRKFRAWIFSIITEYSDNIPECIKERRNGCIYIPADLWYFFEELDTHITDRTLSQELTNLVNDIIPEIKPHTGEKTSRLINRLCKYLGYDKHPDYNREYAKFADGLNPLVIKRHTVLSINPLDYLTMSFGNSWASCHTIDKNNKRNMPNNYSGCYSSGTISYMLDGSSMVFYTVDAKYDGDEYWTQPKINRQMFHWGAEKLVQSRLYPQDNDGNNDAYAPYRNIVQQIISAIFNFPNLWTLSRGVDAASRYITSRGTHYRDYCSFDSCTLSKKSGSENEEHFVVGHKPICVDCGCEHNTEDNINCCAGHHICECCGCVINDEDDVRWVGDYPYCPDCAKYCPICDDYELESNMTYIECEDRSVCEYCLERYYTHCDECGEYYPNDDVTYIDHLDMYVCNECLEYNYTQCEVCGEYYPNDEINYNDDDKALCDKCYDKENEEEC